MNREHSKGRSSDVHSTHDFKYSPPPLLDNITSGDLTYKVGKVSDTKEFASGEDSPKKWIFTSVKNKYTFEIPVKASDASDKRDEHAVIYHSTGENLGSPSFSGTPDALRSKLGPGVTKSKGFKDIQRAIKDQYPTHIGSIKTEEFDTSPSAIFDRSKTGGKSQASVETYRFYHNKIEVPFDVTPGDTRNSSTTKALISASPHPTLDEGQVENTGQVSNSNGGIKPYDNSAIVGGTKAKPDDKHDSAYQGDHSNDQTAGPLQKSAENNTVANTHDSGIPAEVSPINSNAQNNSGGDKAALGVVGINPQSDLVASENIVTKYTDAVVNGSVCTAIATSTALARRGPDVSQPGPDLKQEAAVSAVASAEASGCNPYIAIGRASARAATVATASAAHSVISKKPAGSEQKPSDIAVVISTSCVIKGEDQEVKRDAKAVMQSMNSSVPAISSQNTGAIMDASTQSSPDPEKRRKFRVTIEQPDTPASTRETRTIEFELPPGTDATQFSSLITNAVKKIMDDSAAIEGGGLSEQARFDEAVQNIAREVMQAYTSQSNEPQAIQVKRRKKNKNCFYVRGIPKSKAEKSQKVLGVISDGGKSQELMETNNNQEQMEAHTVHVPKKRKSKSKNHKSKSLADLPGEGLLTEYNSTGQEPNTSNLENVTRSGSTSDSPPKLKGILKRHNSDNANTSFTDPNEPSSPQYYQTDSQYETPMENYADMETDQAPMGIDYVQKRLDRDRVFDLQARYKEIDRETVFPDSGDMSGVQIGKHSWPPNKSASLPYNWPPRGTIAPKEPRQKQEYKSILQNPVPTDSRTPLTQLRKYIPPEKITSETRSKIMESRRGYFHDKRDRSKSTSELDAEFEARKLPDEQSKPKSNFVLVDIDLNAPATGGSPTRRPKVSDLKHRIFSAKPKAPPDSYVEKVWNAKELISKSQDKGLDKIRDYNIDGAPLSPSQASSMESLRRSKSLGLLPSTFFANKQAYPYVTETDIDSGECRDPPLVLETNIDGSTEKSKSMGNLQEDEVFVSNNLADDFERNKSMLVVSGQGDSQPGAMSLAKDQSHYEQSKSAHELRVTKSLSKLNVPDWYTQSNRGKQEIVILNNARHRDLPFSGHQPWKSQVNDDADDHHLSARPVVIQHRVRSPMRSPASSLPSTPRYNASFDDFELPSARLKRNSPQYKTMPLRRFEDLTKNTAKVDKSKPRYPAKEAYLDLKEELTRPPPERSMRSYKSLPANVRLEQHYGEFEGTPTLTTQPQNTGEMDDYERQDVNITSGGIRVSRNDDQTSPTVQRYSTQTQITVEGKKPKASRPSSREGSTASTRKHRSGKHKRKSENTTSSNLDSGHSSMEFDKCLTSSGHDDRLGTYDEQVQVPQRHNEPYVPGVKTQYPHRDTVSTNDSGILDINTYDEFHPRAQPSPQHRLTQEELNERNRIIDGEESMRYGYIQTPQQAPQATQQPWIETPSLTPLQRNYTGEVEEMPPLVQDNESMGEYQVSPGAQRRARSRGSQPPARHSKPMTSTPAYVNTDHTNVDNTYQNYPVDPQQYDSEPPARHSNPMTSTTGYINVDHTTNVDHAYQNYPVPPQQHAAPLEHSYQPTPFDRPPSSSYSPYDVSPHQDAIFSYDTGDDPQARAFHLLRKAAEESSRSLNVSMVSNMSFDVEMLGDDSHFPPISDNKTSVVVSPQGEELLMVKCRNQKCGKTEELGEARKSYKTCHNCYTYYCSRECRKAHWEKHKKRCLFSKVNSICKYIMKNVHDDEIISADFSQIAREGYVNKGRGCVLLVFSSHVKAEEFLSRGMECSEAVPVYCSVEDIQEQANSLGEHFYELSDMCLSYNPDIKFVLDVVVIASLGGGETQSRAPRRDGLSIKKCTKLRLSTSRPPPSSMKEAPETLILTAMRASKSSATSDKRAREVCFINIQKQLRQRGVSLKHHYPDIYGKLFSYVEDNERFAPITIFPFNEETGKKFMCLIMPDSEPDPRLMNKPDILRELGLTTEL